MYASVDAVVPCPAFGLLMELRPYDAEIVHLMCDDSIGTWPTAHPSVCYLLPLSSLRFVQVDIGGYYSEYIMTSLTPAQMNPYVKGDGSFEYQILFTGMIDMML